MSERFVCTAEDPWIPEKGTPAVHPDAECIGETDNGWDYNADVYRCPHCGLRFEIEIAQ